MANKNHEMFDNKVIASVVEDILETKLDAMNYMTIDRDLQHNAGMHKTIYTYSYEGQVEELEMGEGNSLEGLVKLEEVDYVVGLSQHKFGYYDEQAMQDPKVIEVGTQGAAKVMINDLNNKFFAAIEAQDKGIQEVECAALNYDAIIDALAKMDMENEEGLFILVGDDMKTDLRKDEEFKNANLGELLFNGQVGQVAGLPVVHSKKVAAGHAYVMTKAAVTCFIKKDVEIEQDRDADTRRNDIFYRVVNLVALTDATKIVRLAKPSN